MSIYTSPNFIYCNSQDCITEIQERIAAVFNTSTSSNLSISSGLQITNPNNNYFVKVAQGGLDTNNPVGITINPAPTYTNACNFNGDINMNANKISNILNQKFSGGINISDSSTDAEIISNSSGLLSLECSNNLVMNVNNNSIIQLTPAALTLTGTNGIIIDTTSMNFFNGISINDATNSIVGTNSTGLTLNSNNSITLNAPTISIPNLIVTIPSDLTLNSLSYSSGINILDDINHCSITSYNGTVNNSTMDININNGAIYTQLNLLANNVVTPANLIFLNGIRIMDSLSQNNPNITGNGNSLTFTSQEIYLNSTTSYISNIQSNGTLTLTSFTTPTSSTINLNTTNGGTINLTASQVNMISASQVNMATANTSCNQIILTEQTSLPTGQAGSICYYNDSYYVYKVVGGWTLLV